MRSSRNSRNARSPRSAGTSANTVTMSIRFSGCRQNRARPVTCRRRRVRPAVFEEVDRARSVRANAQHDFDREESEHHVVDAVQPGRVRAASTPAPNSTIDSAMSAQIPPCTHWYSFVLGRETRPECRRAGGACSGTYHVRMGGRSAEDSSRRGLHPFDFPHRTGTLHLRALTLRHSLARRDRRIDRLGLLRERRYPGGWCDRCGRRRRRGRHLRTRFAVRRCCRMPRRRSVELGHRVAMKTTTATGGR